MERINFSTLVDASSSRFRLKPDDTCLLLGSCFTENIGRRLVDNKFRALVNPFGVLYNPQSIFSALSLLLRGVSDFRPFREDDLFYASGLWRSWLYSSEFSATSADECLSLVNESLLRATRMLSDLDVLFLTLGANHCYFLKNGHVAVANCHKQPAAMFEECRLSVADILEQSRVLSDLLRLRPHLKIVFTVSPYRYAKYGMHENQISKSTLFLAIDEIMKHYPDNCFYFPAYEIMTDELRDYRFYADDLLHPSQRAAAYIWDIFVEEWMSPEASAFVQEWNRVLLSLGHRPFNACTEEYRRFLTKLADKISTLRQKYPNFVLNNELDEIESRLHESYK